MNRQAIGTVVGFFVGWLICSSLDSPYIRSKVLMAAFFAGMVAQRIVVWLLSVTDDFGVPAPKSEPPRQTWPELIQAADEGKTERVRELLRDGADVNAEREDGYTSLHLASFKGHTDIAAALIDAGADVNKASYGQTPLCQAAANGSVPCMTLLIDHGAVVDRVSDDGYTPLCYAAEHGHVKAIKLLIAKGADVNACYRAGETEITPLAIACMSPQAEPAALLIEHAASLNKRLQDGFTYLHCAVYKGSFQTALLVIRKGVDVNTKTDSGMTAIRMARKLGHTRIVTLLRENGAEEGWLDVMD